MGKKFDRDDVLRFLYDEMGQAEQEDFLLALTEDDELWETFEKLKIAKEGLETSEVAPSVFSCNKVMSFVKNPPARVPVISGTLKEALTLHFVISVFMVLFTTLSIGMVMYSFKMTQSETLYSQDDIRLQWENPQISHRLQMARMNMVRLTEQREAPLPIYQNTYKMVNTNNFSTPSDKFKNIVLLNLH